MEYNLKRKCGNCGNIDIFNLTKNEAAFELYDSKKIWNTPCSKCNSVKCDSTSLNHPELDKELLDIWAANPELFLMDQDEELLLAEIEYLPLLLDAIDEDKYPERKIEVLIKALCVLLYDNTVFDENYSIEENIERERIANIVKPELIKRKSKIIKAGDTVMDYIQEVVYPQIGITA